MHSKTLLSLSACVILFALAGACTKNENSGKAENQEKTEIEIDEAYHSKSDSAFVATIWMDFIGEPDYHFRRASEEFAKNDTENAAYEIRRAASFIQLEQIVSAAESRRALMRTREQMEELAHKVKTGMVTARDLNTAFAETQYSLARYYQSKAKSFWSQKELEKTGYAVTAAALNLESAATWDGQKLKTDDYAVISFAREMAANLIDDTDYFADLVSKSIANLDREIAKFSKKSTIVQK